MHRQGLEIQQERRDLDRRDLEVMCGILGFLSNLAQSQDYIAWKICDIAKGEIILQTQVVGGVSGEVVLGPEASG